MTSSLIKYSNLGHDVWVFSYGISILSKRASAIEISTDSNDFVTKIFTDVNNMVHHVIDSGTLSVTLTGFYESSDLFY